MDSIQTKTKTFVEVDRKCIAQIVAVAEANGFCIYVAWEWEELAKKGVFGFTKSSTLFKSVTSDSINEAAKFGSDISDSAEAKRVFSNLF